MVDLGACELQRAYASGRVSPRDVLDQVYEQIGRDGLRPIWIALNPYENALEALRRAEARQERGSLFGVPFAVKDNIDVAGLPTTAGCEQFAYVPNRNAFVIERLMDAGAIPVGKTNMDQFATGLVGTRSPYGVCTCALDPKYIAGGSSSGSALAVAHGQVSFALGTDTAGSGRVPAALNGIVGLKPSRGALSTRGVVPACRSLDCVSIFARNLEDAARVFAVCDVYDDGDPFSRPTPIQSWTPVHGRIGVLDPDGLEAFGDDETRSLYRAAVAQLADSGWQRVSFDFRPFAQVADLLYQGPWVAERLAALGAFIRAHPQATHPVVEQIILRAARFTAVEAFDAGYELARLRRQIEPLWGQVDAICLPTVPTHYTVQAVLENPIELNQHLGIYTNFANLLDLCAVALPAGTRQSGLPFGVTWFAPAHRDRILLDCVRSPGPPTACARPPSGRVWLAVAGAHLSGQPLNHELTSRGARLVSLTTTAPEYRLFELDTVPPKPGLVHTPNAGGHRIEVEIWELDEAAFGAFVSRVPAPMTIGTTKLVDGSCVKGFSCEPHALHQAREISDYGGWRQYLASAVDRSSC